VPEITTSINKYDNTATGATLNKWTFFNNPGGQAFGIGMSVANGFGMFAGNGYGFTFATGVTNVDGTGATSRMVIKSTGAVGIATSSPATALDVNGTITQITVKSCTLGLTTDALGSITGCVASDQSLKKNIAPLGLSINSLLNLNPVTYEWKNPKQDTQVHAGFIAQQVEKVLPQAVVSAGTGIKGVDANAVLALVVNSIKDMYKSLQSVISHQSEQDKKIEQLQKQVEELQKLINK
jgi:hypothetical protein